MLFTLKNIAKYNNFGGKCKEKQENIKKAQCRCLYLETISIAWKCTRRPPDHPITAISSSAHGELTSMASLVCHPHIIMIYRRLPMRNKCLQSVAPSSCWFIARNRSNASANGFCLSAGGLSIDLVWITGQSYSSDTDTVSFDKYLWWVP